MSKIEDLLAMMVKAGLSLPIDEGDVLSFWSFGPNDTDPGTPERLAEVDRQHARRNLAAAAVNALPEMIAVARASRLLLGFYDEIHPINEAHAQAIADAHHDAVEELRETLARLDAGVTS